MSDDFSTESFVFDQFQRSMRAAVSDLKNRAARLEEFLDQVDSEVEKDGIEPFLDPRTAFPDNVVNALRDASRQQQFAQQESSALHTLFRLYAYEHDKLVKAQTI